MQLGCSIAMGCIIAIGLYDLNVMAILPGESASVCNWVVLLYHYNLKEIII